MLMSLAACGHRVYPTAPALATLDPTVSASATMQRTPTATLTPYAPSTAELADLEATARALMAAPEYALAIPLWDEILRLRPDYGEGYFQRGRAYLGLTDGERLYENYVADTYSSLADLDRSIVFGPVIDGRNYYRRYQALENLAGVEPFRAGRDVLEQVALENLRVSNAIGPWNDVSQSQEGLLLSSLGRCSEAREVGERMLRAYTEYFGGEPGWDVGRARAWSVIASAASCEGRPADAVEAYTRALSLYPETGHWSWLFQSALNLYYLERLQEARASLSQDIDAHPYYSGERYFLRALILYDLGERDAAREDLAIGETQTWMRIGLYPYLVGRLALDGGRTEEAIEALQSAEATFSREYGPLIEWVRGRLADLGAQPLEVLPLSWYETTPIPTLTPSPTPRIPILPGTPAYFDAHVVDMSLGTGPLMIRAQQEFVYCFRFQAEAPIDPASVVSLTLRLIPYGPLPDGRPDLSVSFVTPEMGYVGAPSQWGDNLLLLDPGRYLRDDGEVMMVLQNDGELPLYFQDVGMRLLSRREDGSYLVFGPGAAPHLERLPEEGVDQTVEMPGGSGPLSLGPTESRIIHFTPPGPINYAIVESIHIRVAGRNPGGPQVYVMTWGPWSGGWGGSDPIEPGLLEVQAPTTTVDADGDLVVRVHNLGEVPIHLTDVSVEIVFRMLDGKTLTVGGVE